MNTLNEQLIPEDNREKTKKFFKALDQLANNKEVIVDDADDAGYFKLKRNSEWIEEAKTRPIPNMLFSEFFYENEICILFAGTNKGKSILAVQIADSIGRGIAVDGFKLEAPAQPVLYIDFELSYKQFENRYSKHYADHYEWHANCYRAEINYKNAQPAGYDNTEDYVNDSIDVMIARSKAKIVIVDNLTYLKDETEKAKFALPLMRHLKELKEEYGLTFLLLAHTPKRDTSKPINENDLHGSKMLMNLTDSSFAMGQSVTDKTLLYLKQVKQRHTEEMYGEDNVVLMQRTKPHNFLKMELVGYGKEWEHLRTRNNDAERQHQEGIVEMYKAGKSLREIATTKQLSYRKVRDIVVDSGLLGVSPDE